MFLKGHATGYDLYSNISMLLLVRVFEPTMCLFLLLFFNPSSDQRVDGFGRCVMIIRNAISWRSVVNCCTSMSPKIFGNNWLIPLGVTTQDIGISKKSYFRVKASTHFPMNSLRNKQFKRGRGDHPNSVYTVYQLIWKTKW